MLTIPCDATDLIRSTQACEQLDPLTRAQLFELFQRCYESPSDDYLEKSMRLLRYVSTAHDGERLIAFALGDTRAVALPRLPGDTPVVLAGIGCCDARYRRLGVFLELAVRSSRASGVLQPGRAFLKCGRMAHPASLRTLGRGPGVVPMPDIAPSAWHREVARVVAGLYGSAIDPDTFVIPGNGVPVGFPRLEVDCTEVEWSLFRRVDRSRGDALLAMAWEPEAPAGW